MKWSFTGVGLIVFGLIGLTIIMLFEQITTSNENDYYLLKEITNAAMVDSIDIAYYRETGDLKIVREKFVENFTRRYSESTLSIGTSYIISFYDIMEIPPKVTILIDTGLGQYRIFDDVSNYNVQNTLTGILEYVGKNTKTTISETGNNDSVYTKNKELSKTYYSMPNINENGEAEVTEPINIPNELDRSNIKITELKITSTPIDPNLNDILKAKLWREIDWSRASDSKNRDYKTNYYEEINLNNYSRPTVTIYPVYYDCNTKIGIRKPGMCTGYEDKIWIYWKGTGNATTTALLKLEITFIYDEYEY